QVGRVQHVLRDQGHAGRAVQQDHVVVAGQRLEQPGQLADRLLGVVQQQVHVPVGEVAGQQVEPVEVGALDRSVQSAGALDERLAAALDPGPDAKQVGGR